MSKAHNVQITAGKFAGHTVTFTSAASGVIDVKMNVESWIRIVPIPSGSKLESVKAALKAGIKFLAVKVVDGVCEDIIGAGTTAKNAYQQAAAEFWRLA